MFLLTLALVLVLFFNRRKRPIVLVDTPSPLTIEGSLTPSIDPDLNSDGPSIDALYRGIHRDISLLIHHVKNDRTIPANASVLYAAHASTSLDQENGIPILSDGSTVMSPLDFDKLYPLFLLLEKSFPGTQPMKLIELATSTWPIGHGYRVKAYRPSLIAWAAGGGTRACIVIDGNKPFAWTIDGVEFGNVVDIADMVFSISIEKLGVWFAQNSSTTFIVTVRDELVNMYYKSQEPILVENDNLTSASSRLFTSKSERIASSRGIIISGTCEFGYGQGARRLISIAPNKFKDLDTLIEILDGSIIITSNNETVGQVNLIQNGKIQSGSWAQMFAAKKLPNGNALIYGNNFV